MKQINMTPDHTLPSIAITIQAASQVLGVTPEQITRRSSLFGARFYERARARQITAYVARKNSNRSFKSIARVLNRDHSTIISGCDLISALLRSNHTQTVTAVAQVTQRANELHAASLVGVSNEQHDQINPGASAAHV